MPLWFRAQVSQFEGQIGKARAADLNLSSPQHLVQDDLCNCAQELW